MTDRAPATAAALRDWLRELKDQSQASFADIARGIGEEQRTVKRWMTVEGKPTVPGGDALLQLLDYFGVTLEPPAPRAVALSLMGEIREVQEAVRRFEARQEAAVEMLPEFDRRLEELAESVAEAIELLTPPEDDQERGEDEGKPGKVGP